MSKRKQFFDKPDDSSHPSDVAEPFAPAEPEEKSESSDQRNRPEKRIARTSSDDGESGAPSGLIVHSLESLPRKQKKGEPPKKSTDETTEVRPASSDVGRRKSFPVLIQFLGGLYNKIESGSTDSVDYVCKYKKLTRRNKRVCKGLVKFRMTTEGAMFICTDTDYMLEHIPHDDWCEYFVSNKRLSDVQENLGGVASSAKLSRTDDRPESVEKDEGDSKNPAAQLVRSDSSAKGDDRPEKSRNPPEDVGREESGESKD